MLIAANAPFPSSVELVLGRYDGLIDTRLASGLALEAAITADCKCFLAWCAARRPAELAVPETPETLVHYLRWLGWVGARTRARPPSRRRLPAGSPASPWSTASQASAKPYAERMFLFNGIGQLGEEFARKGGQRPCAR